MDDYNELSNLAAEVTIKALEQLNELLDAKQLMAHEMIALVSAMNQPQQR